MYCISTERGLSSEKPVEAVPVCCMSNVTYRYSFDLMTWHTTECADDLASGIAVVALRREEICLKVLLEFRIIQEISHSHWLMHTDTFRLHLHLKKSMQEILRMPLKLWHGFYWSYIVYSIYRSCCWVPVWIHSGKILIEGLPRTNWMIREFLDGPRFGLYSCSGRWSSGFCRLSNSVHAQATFSQRVCWHSYIVALLALDISRSHWDGSRHTRDSCKCCL